MRESWRTYVPGVRTSAVRYEQEHTNSRKSQETIPLSQPVRQGNREYTISPICTSDVAQYTQTQESPTLVRRRKPTNLNGQENKSDEK